MLDIVRLAPDQHPPAGVPAIVIESVPGMTGSHLQQHAGGMYLRCSPDLLAGTIADFEKAAPGTPMTALYVREAPPESGRPVED